MRGRKKERKKRKEKKRKKRKKERKERKKEYLLVYYIRIGTHGMKQNEFYAADICVYFCFRKFFLLLFSPIPAVYIAWNEQDWNEQNWNEQDWNQRSWKKQNEQYPNYVWE